MKYLLKSLIIIICTSLFFCEFFIYYLVISQCQYNDKIKETDRSKKITAMIIADTHLLGPHRGHWFDKLRREWQMHRSFQTSITLFQPEIVFILGDLFDEGDYVKHDDFYEYVDRFHRLFYVPRGTRIIAVPGNHDVGFHYRMHPFFTDRFEQTFNNTGVSLISIKDVHFVTINSMAMQNDRCYFCESAKEELEKVTRTLGCYKEPQSCARNTFRRNIKYSRPILMQHFPTFRVSDEVCLEHDSEKLEQYRENWEVLSKESTQLLGSALNPRLAFGGHSHHSCRLINSLGIEEFTVASYSWRNKNQPSFLLALKYCKICLHILLIHAHIYEINYIVHNALHTFSANKPNKDEAPGPP
ncbi:metallophosphoesterase 1 homolog isoform X2 [Condylostylus longicornis]|uniref:metallophosphoesterase 1 homolog isoform X2 n=1 Tax=Condylostylus longicornis TaxID=2530218 RepID=UPI00244E2084|nr:metallophosphoesterase 1 homolog isoform X2 [Condylostylus longicornis]